MDQTKGIKSVKSRLYRTADINLMPGELYITDKPLVVTTLLGSCLSVVLFNREKSIAGISHAQLPVEKTVQYCIDNCPVRCNALGVEDNRSRYVTCSTEYMLEKYFALGIRPHEIEVKIFGGADVLQMKYQQTSIGKQNIEMAHDMVDKHKLKLVSEDVGGTQGRKIFFHTQSGDVWVRRQKRVA